MNTIEFTVDERRVSTTEKDLTANEILALASLDPAKSYLVRLEGKHQISYKDRGTESIKVHPHQEFLSVGIGPTPLS
jgi:hypothetical protein